MGSETIAPAASRSASSPSRAMISRMRALPGNTMSDSADATRFPRMACRHRPHVLPRAVGAGPDHDLIDRRAFHLGDRHHAVRGAGQRDERLERGQIQLDLLVVLGIGVGSERTPVGAASEPLEVLPRRLVRGEHAGRQRQLGAHVADGRALGERERGDTGSRVLEHLAASAPRRVAAEQLEDHVLRGDPGTELTREPDARHRAAWHVVRPAAHRDRHVEPARADGQHARRAAERRVAVRAEEELARRR